MEQTEDNESSAPKDNDVSLQTQKQRGTKLKPTNLQVIFVWPVVFCITYLYGAYIGMEPDPRQWDISARFLQVMLSSGSTLVAFLLRYIE